MAIAHAARLPRSLGLAWSAHLIGLVLLLIGFVAVNGPVWQLEPQIFNDSPSYLVPTISLLAGKGYPLQEDGFRQPTFPLYLAILLAPFTRTHLNDCTDAHRVVCIGDAAKFSDGAQALRVIVAANILLGVAITVLLYVLGWRLTHSYVVAVLFGAGYALNVTNGFWQMSILAETLTTFLLLIVLYLFQRALIRKGRAYLGLGIVLGVLALGYQVFLLYCIIAGGGLLLQSLTKGWRTLSPQLAFVILIPALVIGGWSVWNYFENGVFTPSTVGGYVLIQMMYPVAQNAPEGYDGITQTLVGYRDAQIRETGNPTGAVFRAWRDMMDQTDLTFSQVSGKLTTLSLYLAWHYPAVYLDAVGQAAARFWDFAFFHYEPVPRGIAMFAAMFTNARLQQFLNVLFWLATAGIGGIALVQRKRGRAVIPANALWMAAFMSATVWFAAIFSSLTTLGDNARYRVPVMPLEYAVIVFVVWAVARLMSTRSAAQ